MLQEGGGVRLSMTECFSNPITLLNSISCCSRNFERIETHEANLFLHRSVWEDSHITQPFKEGCIVECVVQSKNKARITEVLKVYDK